MNIDYAVITYDPDSDSYCSDPGYTFDEAMVIFEDGLPVVAVEEWRTEDDYSDREYVTVAERPS